MATSKIDVNEIVKAAKAKGLNIDPKQVAFIVGYVEAIKQKKNAPTLPTRQLGNSDLRLSTVSFGCWQFACSGADSYWGLEFTQEMANKLSALAVERGITSFDNAEAYQNGEAEKQLGSALEVMPSHLRKKVVVTTKIQPNNCADVEKFCDAALARLKVDAIDLYLVHWPIDKNSMAHFAGGHTSFGASADTESIKAVPSTKGCFEQLIKLQKAGKIREIGVSNFGVTQLKEALATGARIVVNQLCYNLIFRAIEFDILPLCKANNISVVAYSPLMQGLLTGRWDHADKVPAFRARTRHFDGKRPKSRHGEDGHEALLFKTLASLKAIAAEAKISMADLAVAWPLHMPNVASVICGITKEKYIESNAAAAAIKLSPQLLAKIDAATNDLKQAMGKNADLWQGKGDGRVF